MVDPYQGPYLFDTSAESWFSRTDVPRIREWMRQYLTKSRVHVSSVTVTERIRGYALLWWRTSEERRAFVEAARVKYVSHLGRVLPLDSATAIVAGEILAEIPEPPTSGRRSRQVNESRAERVARWRFDCMIAATALVSRMLLIHNNPGDFEAIRGAIEQSPARFPRLGPLQLIRCQSLL